MPVIARSHRVLGLAVAAGLIALTPVSAHAAPSTETRPVKAAEPVALPIPGFGGIEATSRSVFVAGGASGDGLVVTNLDGGNVRKLTVGATATAIALSRDGKTLYAALRGPGAVAAIDTVTFKETARYATGTCPGTLAVTDRVWFGYGCAGWDGGIGSIDVASPEPKVTLGLAKDFYGAPALAAARDANVLVAGERGLSPATVYSYAQQPDGTLQQKASTRDAGSNLGDLAVTPDGTTVYTACGAPYEISAFATADLTPRGKLATTAYPNSVAITRDGSRVAGGSFAWYDPDVYIFATANPVPKPGTELGGQRELQAGGLAWGWGGGRLFAVSLDDKAGYLLHVLKP